MIALKARTPLNMNLDCHNQWSFTCLENMCEIVKVSILYIVCANILSGLCIDASYIQNGEWAPQLQ